MAISPINRSFSLQNTKEVKKKLDSSEKTSLGENGSTGSASDKIELSPEAMKLHDAQLQSRLTEIRGKIDSGFYNSDQVLNAVAGSLVKVVRGK